MIIIQETIKPPEAMTRISGILAMRKNRNENIVHEPWTAVGNFFLLVNIPKLRERGARSPRPWLSVSLSWLNNSFSKLLLLL